MNSIQVFSNQDFSVRTYTDENGDVWFVAKDVCDVLGIANARDAVSELDDDEKNTVAITDGNRGNPWTNVINEPGLYKLTFKSRKPEAKKFTRWVTHEVLPQLRKTGSYSLPQKDNVPAVQQDNPRKPSLPATSAATKAAMKLVPMVHKCKKKEDFDAVLELDKFFELTFGQSALDIMGLELITYYDQYHEDHEVYGRYWINWDNPHYLWHKVGDELDGIIFSSGHYFKILYSVGKH